MYIIIILIFYKIKYIQKLLLYPLNYFQLLHGNHHNNTIIFSIHYNSEQYNGHLLYPQNGVLHLIESILAFDLILFPFFNFIPIFVSKSSQFLIRSDKEYVY